MALYYFIHKDDRLVSGFSLQDSGSQVITTDNPLHRLELRWWEALFFFNLCRQLGHRLSMYRFTPLRT